jgi:hypothetical protein
MRITLALLLLMVTLAALPHPPSAQSGKHSQVSPKILSAKSVYFDDRTGAAATARKAVEQLKKWGRYEIVSDRKQADLILLFSADPYKGGYIIVSGGQTATIGKNGEIVEDPIPSFNKLAPVRDAYLTVIDPSTGVSLWSDSHVWGGLLTGFDSVGELLVNKLKKQVEK